MSSYYLLPGNLHYSKVQTIPVDIQQGLNKADNAAASALQVQNLNTKFYFSDDGQTMKPSGGIPANITTTVTSTTAKDASGKSRPAYLVHVTGSTDGPAPPEIADATELWLLGGLPYSSTSLSVVDTNTNSVILPGGTMTTFLPVDPGDALTPEVYSITGNEVLLSGVSADNDFPTWSTEIPASYITTDADSDISFDFSFYLFKA